MTLRQYLSVGKFSLRAKELYKARIRFAMRHKKLHRLVRWLKTSAQLLASFCEASVDHWNNLIWAKSLRSQKYLRKTTQLQVTVDSDRLDDWKFRHCYLPATLLCRVTFGFAPLLSPNEMFLYCEWGFSIGIEINILCLLANVNINKLSLIGSSIHHIVFRKISLMFIRY